MIISVHWADRQVLVHPLAGISPATLFRRVPRPNSYSGLCGALAEALTLLRAMPPITAQSGECSRSLHPIAQPSDVFGLTFDATRSLDDHGHAGIAYDLN